MKRYIVEVTRTGYREVEAEDCNSAEEIADNLNACDGVQWSDFVNLVRAWEKDYEGMRWGDLSPEDRKFLLSDYKLTDIDAWENGEHKEFASNGMCFVDMSEELSMSKDTINQCIDYLTRPSDDIPALLIKKEVGSVQPDKSKPPKNVPNIYVLNKEGYKQEIEWALNKMLELYKVDEFYPSKSGNYRFQM